MSTRSRLRPAAPSSLQRAFVVTQPMAQFLEMPSLQPVAELHDPPGAFIVDACSCPMARTDGRRERRSQPMGCADRRGRSAIPGRSRRLVGRRQPLHRGGSRRDRRISVTQPAGPGELTFPGREGDSAEAVYFAAGDTLIVLVIADYLGARQQ